jgi:hypothetical protein
MGRPQQVYLSFLLLVLFAISAAGSSIDLHPYGSERLNSRWKDKSIRIGISASMYESEWRLGTRQEIERAVRNALSSWEAAADVSFELFVADEDSVSPKGLQGDGISLITSAATSSNILLFEGEHRELPAITRVFFDNSGFISEVDIVLNPYLRFSSSGALGSYDLQSVLTHETGHLIGIGHSFVHGSVMFPHVNANREIGTLNFRGRELSAPDVAAAREIYGPGVDIAPCCSSITGRIELGSLRTDLLAEVWAESVDNGDVRAAATSDSDGVFLLGGLDEGTYKVFARASSTKGGTGIARMIGSVELGLLEESVLNGTLIVNREPTQLYFGKAATLSDLPVQSFAGNDLVFLIGGTDVSRFESTIYFSTQSITVSSAPSRFLDYGPNVTVFSKDVYISPLIPRGLYSITLSDPEFGPRILVGVIRITE